MGYQGKELEALNTVHCFQNLFHLLDISKSNGITLDKFVILRLFSEVMFSCFSTQRANAIQLLYMEGCYLLPMLQHSEASLLFRVIPLQPSSSLSLVYIPYH